MKLCLKLHDDHNNHNQNPPLLRAKIPITIFNQPFTSSVATTATATPQDLSFSLSTNFSTGPSFKLTYTPISTTKATTTTGAGAGNPFSLSLKSGLGLFGSPYESPLIFSAQFAISPTNPTSVTPSFFLHFKPQLGNFSLRKTTSSADHNLRNSGSHSISTTPIQSGSPSNSGFANGLVSNETLGWQNLTLEPGNGNVNGPNSSFFDAVDANNGIGFVKDRALQLKDGKRGGFFSGIALKANTLLPVTKRVMVNLRWGVNWPTESEAKLPYLTVNKIEIKRVEKVEEPKKITNVDDLELLKGMCFGMRRNLDILEKENSEMKQRLEEMRIGVSTKGIISDRSIIGKKVYPNATTSSESFGQFESWRSNKNGEKNGQKELKKPVTMNHASGDLESELQKAIKAASS